jgi:hypothetical protein
MSLRQPAIEITGVWKRHWLLVILVAAAIMGLGVLCVSVLRAYGQSHSEYLSSFPVYPRQAGLS